MPTKFAYLPGIHDTGVHGEERPFWQILQLHSVHERAIKCLRQEIRPRVGWQNELQSTGSDRPGDESLSKFEPDIREELWKSVASPRGGHPCGRKNRTAGYAGNYIELVEQINFLEPVDRAAMKCGGA